MSIALETLALCQVAHFKAQFSRIMRIQISREIFFPPKNAQRAIPPPFLSVTNITRAQVTSVTKADGGHKKFLWTASLQNKMADVNEVPASFASNPSLSKAMIFAVMNAIFAIA